MRLRIGRAIGLLTGLGVSVTLMACSSAATPGAADVVDDDVITVASFDFSESELLARIYGRVLEEAGYEVRLALHVGPREFVQPALVRGLVDFVPEYAGTALQFLDPGGGPPDARLDTVHRTLVRAARQREITALDPAPAEDANAVVVTDATAARLRLRTISDLRHVAGELTFGGPPECPTRPLCLAGLRRVYDLEFADFVPLDVGGPLTLQALESGGIDVALLFTTDPAVTSDDLRVLIDDRRLQPAENVIPLVRQEVVDRWGSPFVSLVDAVSGRLTTDELRELNALVADGTSAEAAADSWLDREGLG